MHTSTCTRANSAKSAVREIIDTRLREIGAARNKRDAAVGERISKELGIPAVEKQSTSIRNQLHRLYQKKQARQKAVLKEEPKDLQAQRLCDLRREILFANAQRVREIYAELTK